jgi:hypothetical protein
MKRIFFPVAGLMSLVWIAYFLFFQTNWLNGKSFLDQKDSGKKPKIKFEKTEFDFGTITEGKSVEFVFKFSNIGNDTLVITSVRASCGCTAVLLSEKIIAPGGSGEIKVVFDSHGRPGNNRKSISIISNDTDNQQIVLRFTVNVQAASEKSSDMETLFK